MSAGEPIVRQWLLDNISLRAPDPPAEERASGWTHLLGVVLSVIGTGALLLRTLDGGERGDVVGVLVYGLSMTTLYAASTSYHLSADPVRRRFFRMMDHVSIYLLIAGTYTPITLAIGGRVGWGVFATVWTMAALGIAATFRFWGRYRLLHVAFYVATGWSIVIAWRPVMEAFSTEMFAWVLAGGVTYTVGAVVYSIKRLPYNHAIWHLFVLGGSACFFVGIYRNILLM